MSKVTRIAKLFAQAADEEKNGNTDGGKLYATRAMELCQKYGVSVAEAHAEMNKEERRHTMVVRDITIGNKGAHGLRMTTLLMGHVLQNLLGTKNDLRHDGTALVLYGTEDQADMAEQITESVLQQMEEALVVARKEHRKSTKPDVFGYREKFSTASFKEGYMQSMLSLSRQVKKAREEEATVVDGVPVTGLDDDGSDDTVFHAGSAGVSTSSAEIAVRELGMEVQDFYKRRSNARGSFRVASNTGAGYGAGVSAGRSGSLSTRRSLA